MSFSSLGLSAELLRAVTDQGYSEPTPVQSQAIPVILEGRDVLAGAQTGTGKTAGFTLPLLQRLAERRPEGRQRPVRGLVLTPTRELAAQVRESVIAYGKHLPLKSAAIFGGVGFRPQVDALRRGVDILVATPGRLIDHVDQRTLDLSKVEILVLDEADRMLDMGFIHAIRKIISLLPQARQNLLFSATFSDEIKSLASTILKNPAHIEVARRNATAERVSHAVHPVDRDRKRELLSHMIGANNWQQVLVFTRTKHGADRLADQLERDGLSTAAIHGNKSQGARTRALSDFKRGSVRVLVATDIAARGIDIDQLPYVVNYELPHVPEDYVHRIGRTGRAGMEGNAVSLVSADERKQLRDIERLLKQELPKSVMPGYEPSFALNGREEGGHRSSRGASGRPGGRFSDRSGDRSGQRSGERSGSGDRFHRGGEGRSEGRPEGRSGEGRGRPGGYAGAARGERGNDQRGNEQRSSRAPREGQREGGYRGQRDGQSRDGQRSGQPGQRAGSGYAGPSERQHRQSSDRSSDRPFSDRQTGEPRRERSGEQRGALRGGRDHRGGSAGAGGNRSAGSANRGAGNRPPRRQGSGQSAA
jgi:ATP-dependent RNA helicase RhlE